MRRAIVLTVALGTLSGAAGAQTPAMGPEFQVNAYTTGGQSSPAVASGGDGSFVVVWNSAAQYGYAVLMGRRFDATGAPLTGEFRLEGGTTSQQLARIGDLPYVERSDTVPVDPAGRNPRSVPPRSPSP